MIQQHPDYSAEHLRLDETKKYLEATIAAVFDKRIRFNEEMRDAYLNLDSGDGSASYATIMFNAQMLDHLEEHFEQLLLARKKPYFARIDVRHNDRDTFDTLYLGKVSLFDESMPHPLVVDWRAPVASLYYDGRLGKSSYVVEEENVEIELALKRQYTLENGHLIDFMDVDISTSDTFLQAALNQHAGEKLKDIVSTIQAEQNTIIRADIHKPLIVQGVAGSGKTTIALHRIAYLIYTYAKSFHPKDFMIIAPNTLFLDYISSVLPELGAEKVVQTTFVDLMFDWLGKRVTLAPNHEKLNGLVSGKNSDPGAQEQLEASVASAAFKNSMAMKNLLDAYVLAIEGTLLPPDDLMLDNLLVLSGEAIKDLYYGNYGYLPLYARIEAIKRYMQKQVKDLAKRSIAAIEDRVGERIKLILFKEAPGEARREKVVGLMTRREERIAGLKQAAKTAVSQYLKKVPKDDVFGYYQKLLSSERGLISRAKGYEQEDLAPLVYLKSLLFGIEDTQMKYAVIDEAQDFGVFQFYVIKQMLRTERFTILGDLAQGIHMYRALSHWDELNDHVFTQPATYLTLEQSYRTTIEIMDCANGVLEASTMDDLILAKPVVRHGERPLSHTHRDEKALVEAVADEVKWLKDQDFTTIALIVKSSDEARWLRSKLERHPVFAQGALELMLIDEHSKHFDHQVVVVPSYLAKGLEFDAVLSITVHEHYDNTPLNAKLLYVAMTRAMHHLSMHSLG